MASVVKKMTKFFEIGHSGNLGRDHP